MGDFKLNESYTLVDLAKKGIEKCLIQIEKVFKSYNKVELTEEEYKKLNFGQTIEILKVPENIKLIAGFFDKKLIGMIERIPGKRNLFKYCKKLNII